MLQSGFKSIKKHTSWFRRYGFTKAKWPEFHSESENKGRVQ